MKQEAKKRVIYKIDIFLIALQSIVAVLLGIQLIRMSIVPPLYMVLYFAIVLVVDPMGRCLLQADTLYERYAKF